MLTKGISFTFFSTRPLKAALLAGVGALALATSSRAVTLYSTSFEAPTFTSGTSVVGVDGWLAGSSSGNSQTVSTAQANPGTQSLLFDNSGTNTSFYSVRRSIGTFAGTVLTLSVNVYISSTTTSTRDTEVMFSTGTLGGCTLGFSIDGGGSLRAGTTWGALYANAALATAPAGTFADRWLTVNLSLNTGTGVGTVSASGFGGTATSFSTSFTGVSTAGTYFNLGTDYEASAVTGISYFDNVNLSAVPEPSTLAASALGVGLLGAYLRRRRTAA